MTAAEFIEEATESGELLAIESWLDRVTAADVLNELVGDAESQLQAAFKRNDVATVGRIVMNVRKAYATQLALSDIYGFDSAIYKRLPDASKAADMALKGVLL